MKHIFDTVAIVGPGLIGGSIGLGIRRRKLAAHLVGIGRRASSLRKARQAGAVDSTTTDLEAGTRSAELVVLATPVNTFGELAMRLARCMKEGALVTEVGSTKESVIEAISQALEVRNDLAFIPTHPMAGSEKRGAENATPDLFEDSRCIFTPVSGTPPGATERLKRLWEALGAEVHFMTPRQHDRLVARISHLPHIAASALINTIEEQEGVYAGGGLIDTTRVASGEPNLWKAICQSNPHGILEALDSFSDSLAIARKFLAEGDFEGFTAWLEEAKKKRDDILEMRKKPHSSPQKT